MSQNRKVRGKFPHFKPAGKWSVDKQQTSEIVKLKKSVKKLKSDVELKEYNYSIIAYPTDGVYAIGSEISNAIIFPQYDITANLAQGTTSITRLGNKISVQKFKIKAILRCGSLSTVPSRVRMFIHGMTASTASLGTGDYPLPYQEWTDAQRANIGRLYMDKIYTILPNVVTGSSAIYSFGENTGNHSIVINTKWYKCKKQTRYVSGANTTEEGGIMVAFISDTANAVPATTLYVPQIRELQAFIRYTDS